MMNRILHALVSRLRASVRAVAPIALLLVIAFGVSVVAKGANAGQIGQINFGNYDFTPCYNCTTTVPDNTLPPEIQAPNDSNSATITIGNQTTDTAGGSLQTSVQVNDTLAYAWNRWLTALETNTGGDPNLPSIDNKESGYVSALSNPNITVGYDVAVTDVSGNAIARSATVSQGQSIKLVFEPFVDHNISWFGTGFSDDSPYGHWVAGAAAPARSGVNVSCNTDDYVTSTGALGWTWDIYIPFDVNQPTVSLSNTSGLSCGVPSVSGGATTYACTVTGTGSVSPTFNFSSTYGYFYYRYYDDRDGTSGGLTIPLLPGCYGNNIPLADQSVAGAISSFPAAPATGYQVAIPAVTSSYPLTVGVVNHPPNVPTITGPTTGYTNTSYNYTFTATDPDNDQVKYGINDWISSNTLGQWAPSSGLVNSGTGSSATHTWSTPGTYQIYAEAQDANGNTSAWSAPYTVTISTPTVPTATMSANPISVIAGSSSTLTYSCASATSGTLIDQNSGTSVTNVVADGANHTTPVTPSASDAYILTCTSSAGQNQAVANVTVTAALTAQCSVLPTSANTGQSVTWTAYPSGGTGSYTYSWSAPGGSPSSGSASTLTNSYSSAGNYSATVNVTSGSQSTGAISCTTTTIAAGKPDLTGNAMTSGSSVVAGIALPLSSSISNIGSTTATGTFPNMFDITQGTTVIAYTPATSLSNLAASASANISGSYTFASAGTYVIYACADLSSTTGTGVITESNEENNCGPGQTVTVSAAPLPDLTAGTVSPTSATQNVAVTLTSTAINNGSTTASNFPNVFQVGVGGPYTAANTVVSLANGGASAAISASYTFTSIDSYQVRACANMNTSGGTVVAESNTTNNCGNWQTVTVVAPGQPNLTAGTPTPATAVANQATTYTSVISNTGSVSTGAPFTDLIQRATDSIGSNATDMATYSNATLAASPATTNATFPVTLTSGTWYLRVCADKQSSAGTGVITESNENDNCTPWTAVTVSAALSAACSVVPTAAATGQSVTWTAYPSGGTGTYTYTWTATGGTPATGSASTLVNSYSTAGIYSASVKVTSGSQTYGPVACSTNTTVTPALPDLTAGAVSPAAATAGTAATFNASVFNTGSTTTSIGFTDLFQKANDASGTGSTDIGTYASAAIAAGGNNTASLSYNFSSGDGGTTKYLRVCADKSSAGDTNGVIVESNENNNCGAWTAVVVSTPALPDLTAGATSPATATVSQAVTLSSTIMNSSRTTASGSSSPSVFQIGSGGPYVAASTIGVLAALGSSPTTASYTFNSSGSYLVRACADMLAPSGSFQITESDYTDNCGTWQTVTVSPAASPAIASCTPSPLTATPNQSVTWSVTTTGFSPNPTSYTWLATGGTPSSQSGSSATFASAFATGGNYAPTVSATNGTQSAGPTSCTPVSVSGETSSCSDSESGVISASPTRVVSGGSAVIIWSATGVAKDDTCTVTGPSVGGTGSNTTTTSSADASCNVEEGQTTISNITGQGVYIITCDGASQQVIVNVQPSFTEF